MTKTETAACILCSKPVILKPGQYHYCQFPKSGPAHIDCAAKRPSKGDPSSHTYCWYVICVDEADNTYLGTEGPFWSREAAQEQLKAERARGARESEILQVPFHSPEEIKGFLVG